MLNMYPLVDKLGSYFYEGRRLSWRERKNGVKICGRGAAEDSAEPVFLKIVWLMENQLTGYLDVRSLISLASTTAPMFWYLTRTICQRTYASLKYWNSNEECLALFETKREFYHAFQRVYIEIGIWAPDGALLEMLHSIPAFVRTYCVVWMNSGRRTCYKKMAAHLDGYAGSREGVAWVSSVKGYTLAARCNELAARITRLALVEEDGEHVSADHLPQHVTHLILDREFNGRVNKLPPNLECLRVLRAFNRIVNALPPTLRHLRLGFKFNHSVTRLPAGLVSLRLGYCFNHPVDKLPTGLSSLVLSGVFNKSLDCLPDGLESLTIRGVFNGPLDSLPPSLVTLVIGDKYKKHDYYIGLRQVMHFSAFDQPLDFLPPTLRHLTVQSFFNHPVDHLPPGLKILKIGCFFNQSLDRLPPGLETLQIGDDESVKNIPSATRGNGFVEDFLHARDRLPRAIRFLDMNQLVLTDKFKHNYLSTNKYHRYGLSKPPR